MWHHAPAHELSVTGTFIVTAGTLHKQPVFTTPSLLDLVEEQLFVNALYLGWELQAWAILSNHYHFVASAYAQAKPLSTLIQDLHARSATAANRLARTPGRKVWFQYWETRLTFQRSYFARLSYVHQNPAHHRIVTDARQYQWCSAAWFEREAAPAFQKTVAGFRTDRLNVPDDFEIEDGKAVAALPHSKTGGQDD
jgi:putative transposase